MLSAKHRLLEIFRKTSFKSSNEPVFRLASGKRSKYYVDCKQALSYPEARGLIGELILPLVRDEPLDAIGGLELGAYPIATSVSDAIFRRTNRTVRAFVIRKEPKTHGVTDLIAGDVRKGDKALIVDDVVTSGQSTVQAIKRAREAGLSVDRVIVLVDREEDGGRRHIEAQGVEFCALFTLSDFLGACNDHLQNADGNRYQRGSVRKHSGSAVPAR